MQFLVTTTGDATTVILFDLGRREIVHPTIDLDLAIEFAAEEIRESNDLQNALDNNWLTAKDENDNVITSVEQVISHFDILDLSADTHPIYTPTLGAARVKFKVDTPVEGEGLVYDSTSQSFIDGPVTAGIFQDFYKAESLGVSTTTSAAPQTKVTLNTGVLPIGTYRICVSYGWNYNSTFTDFLARVQVDGATVGQIHRQEPKDSSGTWLSTGADQREYITRVFYIDATTAAAHTITLQWASGSAGTNASIWDAMIELWRVS